MATRSVAHDAVAVGQLRPGTRFRYDWNPVREAEVLSVGPGSATVVERRGTKQVTIHDPHDRSRVLRSFVAEDRSKPYQISLVTRVHPAGRDPAWDDAVDGEE